jgi:hypothetical protein
MNLLAGVDLALAKSSFAKTREQLGFRSVTLAVSKPREMGADRRKSIGSMNGKIEAAAHLQDARPKSSGSCTNGLNLICKTSF